MRTIATLLRKDLANFSRDKAAVSLTFLVPVVLIYIFGQVFGLNRKDSGPTGIRLAVINESTEPAAQNLVDALAAEKAFRVVRTRPLPDKTDRPLTEADVRAMMRENQLRFAVVLPRDLLRKDGIGVRVKILSNPRNDIETQMVNGLLQKTIFSSAPELLGQSLQDQAKRTIGDARLERFNDTLATTIATTFGGSKEEILRRIESGDFGFSEFTRGGGNGVSADGASNALAEIIRIETEQVVGGDVKSPEATRVVGGWAMMFLLFAVSGSASSFFDEKKTGIFQRLLSAPVTRAHLLWSRFLFGTMLGLVQLTALFIAGRVLYGVDVFGNFGNLVVICLAAGAASTAFGMLVVALTTTPAAAQGLATFVVLTMSACGGAWFPISLMPEFMQQAAKFTIVYWAMEGFSQVLWARHTLVQLLPTLGILLATAAGVMAVAIWRFNRGRLFE